MNKNYNTNFPSGVALWTDPNRRLKHTLSEVNNFSPEYRGAWLMFHPPPTNNRWATHLKQRANTNFFNYFNTIFKLERTSYISHEQTQVFDKNLKRKNEKSRGTNADQSYAPFSRA